MTSNALRSLAISLPLLLPLAAAPAALAQPAGAPEPVGPVAGSRELRLGQGFFPGISVTGLNVYGGSSDDDDVDDERLVLLGASVGYGTFLTDNLEVGANVNLLFGRMFEENVFGPGVSPFVRLMSAPARLRLFAELSGTYNAFFAGDDTGHLFGGGLDAGVEYAVTPSWSLRISPNYRYLRAADNDGVDDVALHTFGVNWGISAYF